jgi:AcrR family transcriptional regulator
VAGDACRDSRHTPRHSAGAIVNTSSVEENRRRLLEAAREVFAESGLDATLDEVAARAGVDVGMAYRRFANKDELIAAPSEDWIARVSAIIDHASAEPDPWQGIVAYLEDWLAMHAGDRGPQGDVPQLSSPRSGCSY